MNKNGGGGEIRTHETFSRLHAFQACSIGHSDTPPKKSDHHNTTYKSLQVFPFLLALNEGFRYL
jgi:hypothetical protein